MPVQPKSHPWRMRLGGFGYRSNLRALPGHIVDMPEQSPVGAQQKHEGQLWEMCLSGLPAHGHRLPDLAAQELDPEGNW
jgi:hypothetical protein